MRWQMLFWILLAIRAASGPAEAAALLDVRVGILAYEDIKPEIEHCDRLFAEISNTSVPPVRFQIAVGTYADILHWLDHG